MKKIFYCLLCCLWSTAQLYADNPIKFKFRSRALVDVTASSYAEDHCKTYFRLRDFRAGFKAFYSNFELKVDVSLAKNKINFKDAYLAYHFDKAGLLVAGNSFEMFGMDGIISSVDYRFNREAIAAQAFAEGRKLGIAYHYHNDKVYAATGVFTPYDVNQLDKKGNKEAWVTTTRAAWKHIKDNKMLQLGGAFSYRSVPDEPYDLLRECTGVSGVFDQPLLRAELPHIGKELKVGAELLYTSPKWMLQTEYFFDAVDWKDKAQSKQVYKPHGGYVQASYLLVGKGYSYDADFAVASRPASKKAVELIARFNYTQMNQGAILGGEEKDASLGLNVYFNAYLGLKLDASYVWTGDNCQEFYKKDLFLVQTRLQYVF